MREKNLATLRAFAQRQPGEKRKRVHFLFRAKPVEVLNGDRVRGLRLERTRVDGDRAEGTGEVFDISCGVVISAIGYRMPPLAGVPVDEAGGIVRNQDGRVAPGLYAVGWAKRGPVGVIGTNKADGDLVARQIAEDIAPDIAPDIARVGRPGGPGLEGLLRGRGVRWVTFADWLRIEAAEVAAAPPGAPRRKLIRINDMLRVLDESCQVVTDS
jgi:ferredoxin--NADP+ reductase